MATVPPMLRQRSLAWRSVTLAVVLGLLTAACGPAADVAGDGGPAAGDDGGGGDGQITMARATWDTGFMQAYIYRDLLTELGYDVSDPSEATLDPNVFYPALAEGDFDLWANGWFPLHDIYLERELFSGEQNEEPITPVGTQVDGGALQGYLVDKKTADEMGLTSMSDLTDADTAAAFDGDGNGQADLIGCNDGWGCNAAITEQINTLDWGANVEQIVGDYSVQIDEVAQKVDAGEPVLFYTWTPNWTIDVLVPGEDVVWLESPPLPGDDESTTADGLAGCATGGESCELGWVVNDIRAVVNNDFLENNPDAAALLEAVQIPLSDISAQNAEMNEAGDSYTEDDIAADAAEWIEQNRDAVDGWLEQARSAGS
ncbi:MAG TPA: glycine betaine/L-proline ABC transporter substrate-binding protein ProX [Euzebyales bacterium]